ncbi:hypothetical protein [Pseudescherichia vulneris]|uniref:hypothetical protein n=1 Tax=Pseudescherichia vulneris TaxID=566 RepID=UPI0028A6CA24|nr:hypothetical protein [Pseudescherichia vulneris]
MNQKYIELLRYKIALDSDLFVQCEVLLHNPLASSKYRINAIVPENYDFELIQHYIYLIRETDSGYLITLPGAVYTMEDIERFNELTKERTMKTGFTHNGIVVPAEQDVRHINKHIDAGHPDVKAYIENLEDMLEWAYRELLKYEPDNDFVLEQLELNEERNARTRK